MFPAFPKYQTFILLITLSFIFLICTEDRYSTPLDFDTFFRVDGPNPFNGGLL